MEKKNEVLKFLYSLKNTLMHMSIEALKDAQLQAVQNTLYTLLELEIQSELKKTEVKKFLFSIKNAIMAMSVGSLEDYSFMAIEESLFSLMDKDLDTETKEEFLPQVKDFTYLLKDILMSMSLSTVEETDLEATEVFLQAASEVGEEPVGKIILDTQSSDPSILSISCTGEIKVFSIKNGAPLVETYADLDEAAIAVQADANTQIIISGAEITYFEAGDNVNYTQISVNNTALTELDLNTCKALTTLGLGRNTALATLRCNNCPSLTALDLSKNTALTELYCDRCAKLVSISYPATNEGVSTSVAGAITGADAADGTVYTDSEGAYYSTIADAATTKGWTIEQIA
jgi:hypothetical protein